MCADLAVRDVAVIEPFDQEGAGYIENVGRLLGGKFGVDGYQVYGIAFRHFGQDIDQEPESSGGTFKLSTDLCDGVLFVHGNIMQSFL